MRSTKKTSWLLGNLCAVILMILGCSDKTSESTTDNKPTESVQSLSSEKSQTVGGDKDEHGCIGSAGYQWCANESRCVRSWEITKKNGLDNTAEAFIQLCGKSSDVSNTTEKQARVGNDRDENNCIASAGYQWCEKTNQCERAWELAEAHGFENTSEGLSAFCTP